MENIRVFAAINGVGLGTPGQIIRTAVAENIECRCMVVRHNKRVIANAAYQLARARVETADQREVTQIGCATTGVMGQVVQVLDFLEVREKGR